MTVGKVWGGATAPIGVSEPELLDWRERSRSFTRIEFSALATTRCLAAAKRAGSVNQIDALRAE